MKTINNSEFLSFDKIEFRPEWEYTNPDTGARFKGGVIPGKVLYTKLEGALSEADLSATIAIRESLHKYGSFQNSNLIRISDYSTTGKISFSARNAYAKTQNALLKKYNCCLLVTYIVGASGSMKSVLSIFQRITNQYYVFTGSIDEAFYKLNTTSSIKNHNSIDSATAKNITFEGIEFRPEWEYINPDTGAFYKSGIIPGRLFYTKLQGNLSEADAPGIIKTLESVYADGLLLNSTVIRLSDYSTLGKVSLSTRKTYAKILNTLNEKYNCKPAVTYIVGASAFVKSTLSLFKRFVNQNMVFFNTMGDAFERIHSDSSTSEDFSEETVTVRISDIDEINALAGSLLFQNEDNAEDIFVSPGNPLSELASALIVAKEDLKQMYALEKVAGEKLATSMVRFQNIANIADWIWEVDINGRYTYCSDKVEDLLGYTPDEMHGKTAFDFMVPENREENIRLVGSITSQGRPLQNFENWNLTKDGKRVCFLTNGVPIHDSNGKMTGYRGIDDDITRRKKTEKLLIQSERFQREIMESVDAGIVVIDPETHLIEKVNSAAEEMFGARSTDITGKVCHNFLCPTEKGCCPITDCDQTVQRSEKIMLRADGTRVPILKTVKCLEIGGRKKLLETFVDIKDLKNAEIKLQNQTILQQILMDISTRYINLPLAEIKNSINGSLKKIGEFVGADRSYIFNYDFRQNTTSNTYEFCSDGTLPQIEKLQNLSLSLIPDWVNTHIAGQPMLIEDVFTLPETSGVRQVLEPQEIKSLLTIPMISNGECIGFVGFDWVTDFHSFSQNEQALLELFSQLLVNIEHRVATEIQLSVEKDNAQAANKAKSEFLANMSHEIRTPLNGVLGMNTLLMDTILTDEQKSYVRTVRSSGEALLNIINDILDFSKIEAGKLELEDIQFNLRLTLEDFAEIMAIKTEEKGLEFICATAPDVPSVIEGDPGRLRQILVNLAGNAIKFTSSGEVSVTATVHSQTEKDIRLRFSVKDTGIGISQKKLKNIFGSFTQADSSTTREFGGTGLGLAISKQLTELMGGEIGVNSKPGEGSEFWFTIDFRKSDASAQELSPSDALRETRILIVDDNATNRDILSIQFKAWGIRSEEASDGSSALRVLYDSIENNDPFQIAVLDMQMPGMNGETLGIIMKSDKRLHDIRLLMMTSLGQRGDSKRMKEIGFSAYLTKPVRQSELFEALAVILGLSPKTTGKTLVTKYSLNEMKLDKFRVLLVEDNITNQMVAMGILKRTGIRVDAVANGREAMVALEQIPYDLVFMDVQMPVMDGLEATKTIRSQDSNVRNRNIPIIAMTAHAMQGDREICLEAGMNDYVTKPIGSAAVAEVLKKWLDYSGSTESTATNQKSGNKLNKDNVKIFNREEFLDRMMDDKNLAALIISEFMKNAPQLIIRLTEHIHNDNAIEAGQIAHSLKGSAANLSASEFVNIAFEMEQAGKTEDISLLEKHLPVLRNRFSELQEALIHFGRS